ncbi:MAG: phospholipid/cholesterol/gamma-HCH transport system substrate-binding protein [Pseudonocardiales bacterium]|jgi:phospholipid/cholesterol/gamma-HCH transport system substrate-binding protein|nr:phospholipid/cholesterol/gamma-HCH transport system substrate-binding protein [Pseudonocardiales bacterium]
MAKLPFSAAKIVIGVIVAAIVGGGAYYIFFSGSSTKIVTARFASAVGVYPGTPVKVLGVGVGEVTKVKPTGGYVAITMSYDSKYKLSANVGALEVANSLVSDRFIQLTPLYNPKNQKDKVLASGATIPMNRTQSPAELDDIYRELDKLAVALGPNGANKGGKTSGALSALINVSAANLKGNGAALGNSITKLSQAAQTLANGRNDLFGTVRNLQKFTATLKASDTQVRLFNQQLAQVAGDLAAERADLGNALHDLGLALDDVGSFVKKNANKFHVDIKGLEKITGILVKEKSSLNETLAIAPVALANIVHAYDPDVGVIATRSNLFSLTSASNLDLKTLLEQVTCKVLGKLNLGIPGLTNACKKVPALSKTSTATGTAGAPSTPGSPNLLGTILNGGIPSGQLVGSTP